VSDERNDREKQREETEAVRQPASERKRERERE
jgi:hypothetical protein